MIHARKDYWPVAGVARLRVRFNHGMKEAMA
jgi:hypothetical protein